jgi:ribose transport system substrate-binding protein
MIGVPMPKIFAVLVAAVFVVSGLILIAGCESGNGARTDTGRETTSKDAVTAEAGGPQRPKIAFVTNGIANFWKIAEAGALAASDDFECDVEVKMPPSEGGRAANQKRMLEQLISKGIEGVAVSPVDPANQTDILNEVGNHAKYITHDSDAPDTNRLLYIGMSNYDAGRMAGELVKEAIADGGNIVVFIGSLEQHNAKLRRQGLIDEVLDRSHDPTRYDQPGDTIGNGKYTFLATRVDDFNDTRKKELPEQALAKFDKIDCMVGLFEYNPPFIFDALNSAGKLGKIKVVGFDENKRTLEEIKTGNCVGTVVQNPYMYGYKSVEVLSRLVRGDRSDLSSEFLDIPARKIVRDNVRQFQDELEKKLSGHDLSRLD